MELIEITPEEYEKIVENKEIFFMKKKFLELNKSKVEKVHYFLGYDKKNRLAFAVGEKENEWRAPYSAPFTAVVELQKITPIEYYWEFIALLNQTATEAGIRKITVLLPPDIYGAEKNAKMINALLGSNYMVEYEEINYSLDIRAWDADIYRQQIAHNARKNLRIALESGLSLVQCLELEEKRKAYEIIRINRKSRGYPLRMTWEQVLETLEIVKHDVFVVQREDIIMASAIVFYVSAQIVQVIYWGNIPNTEEYKPINFLAYELIEYYKEQGIEMIDIGPSSENGIPNYGLCSFKESIGCKVTSKYRLSIDLVKNGYYQSSLSDECLRGGRKNNKKLHIVLNFSLHIIKNMDSPFHFMESGLKCA